LFCFIIKNNIKPYIKNKANHASIAKCKFHLFIFLNTGHRSIIKSFIATFQPVYDTNNQHDTIK